MSAAGPLPRRLDAAEDDLELAREAASAIAAAATGRDPGPMTVVASMSHYVVIAADVVVKLADGAGHERLALEATLATHLPSGLGAPLLASGRHPLGMGEVHYACFIRVPGEPPGVGLPGVEAATARRWTEQAVRRLSRLHAWRPTDGAEVALRRSPTHEGFTGRAALIAGIEAVLAADRDGVLARPLIDGLIAIAENAPTFAATDVPVHADCDWANWLVDDQDVTALLDFERARLGDPTDDWVLLAATSGPHITLVLDVIAEQTATSLDTLRAACEVRDAALVADDLRRALDLSSPPVWMAHRVRDLEELVIGRRWYG